MLRRFTSERIRKVHRQRLIFTVSLWSALGVSVFLLIVTLLASKQIAITTVAFQGNKAISSEELFAVVAPELDGSYLYLVSRRNIFLFPQRAIEDALFKSFVRIKGIGIDRDGLKRIVITIDERNPAGLWCGTASSSTNCYFVDDDGLAFSEAPRLTGRSFVVYERDFPTNPVGAQLAPVDAFDEMGALVDMVATLGFTTRRVVWSADALELITSYVADGADAVVRLRVPLVGPYETALTNLASIVQSQKNNEALKGKESAPLDVTNLDYIDLRFENRVFYKSDSAAAVPHATTTETIE